ncbi:monooxygenase family protein [Streptomonospora nanhaiensis]|uniref:DUF4188 domain-containing protein n=1 Tax=Streptomonospora nanhaiensis TaxID=1323731 RepID=A0A853BMD4_9ACTN|nr:DUF4188 domain-containing protein [Streptomonospora nanhaiensis]MBV2365519.1 DUF4188 domain-containing protein [Streptomonospora nanhaiensis]MBX9391301.1 DUF4188 domain-containing protein [Streptomonospora nanhaiensis]NYI95746.1 hypothetical protein [Streptomonospora nanhaiensis]
MPQTQVRRTTTEPRESLTVFLLGVRVNALLRPRRWMWINRAFLAMSSELRADPALGLLHERVLPSARGVTAVQYWESTRALMDYARRATHSAAWQRYLREGGAGAGVWHETYEIGAPQSERAEQGAGYEAVYLNMPDHGLGRALGTVPVDRSTRRALDRLARRRTRGGTGAGAAAAAPDAR